MKKNPLTYRTSPDLQGKIAIVTGANTGLGFETAKALAGRGAHVVMACRNEIKAHTAAQRIRASYPKAALEVAVLDLAELASVRAFAEKFNQAHGTLDILVNNAGIMMPPYTTTKDGFEQQWGVNHLAHFLLTALVFDRLEAAEGARVVHLSSLAHKWANIYFDDLNFTRKYDRQKSYGQSKLACMVFGYEMQRRLDHAGSKVKSIVAHPGISDTELFRHLPKWMQLMSPIFSAMIAQPPKAGAQPSLRAALDLDLKGGEYIGPDGMGGWKGKAVVVKSHPKSKNKEVAKRLWQVSEKATSCTFKIASTALTQAAMQPVG